MIYKVQAIECDARCTNVYVGLLGDYAAETVRRAREKGGWVIARVRYRYGTNVYTQHYCSMACLESALTPESGFRLLKVVA